MANGIPNTKGNAHSQTNAGGNNLNKHPVQGKKHAGKDEHAGKHHHKMNRHHKVNHALGHVETTAAGTADGTGMNHEEVYNDCD